ncbi:CocE/NonD family hydrolase [Microbacterium schleiferi]|nr:CocE/NonD family hydrolase [Microbacterium schleiferi]
MRQSVARHTDADLPAPARVYPRRNRAGGSVRLVPVPPPQRFRHSPAWVLGRVLRRIRLFAKPRVDVDTAEPDWMVERDIPVTVRDGTVLRVNVFRPRGDEPVPVIMSAHPYGKDQVPARAKNRRAINPQYRIMPQPGRVGISAWTGWEAPDPAFWVPRGYAVVNADARGGGTSAGEAHLFEAQEADDYEDLIAWAGTQPWSTGKVGLDGVSYLAISQYGVAARSPEHLAAICPWEGFSDLYRDFAWPGGIRENGFAVLWTTLTARAARIAPPPLRRELARRTTRDQWYRDRTPHVDSIGVPVLVCGSFSDHNLHTRGSFEVFRRAGRALPERPARWLYTHRGGKWATYYDTDAASIRTRFFDHTLRGADNGWDTLPPVRLAVYERGPVPAAVTAETEWPPADLRMRRLHLDGLDGSLQDLPPRATVQTGFAMNGPGLEWTWPVPEDLDVIGPMSLRLHVAARAADDLTLFVGIRKVSDGAVVPFEGSYGFDRAWMSYGWQRVGFRDLDPDLSTDLRPVHTFDRVTPIRPGEVVPVDIELREQATRFRAGDQLRLVVRGRWVHSRNPVTGSFPAGYVRRRGGVAIIHTGPEHPSSLLLGHRPPTGAPGEPWLTSAP